MHRLISFVVPVYNRPEEIDELLASMRQFDSDHPFEVVVVEDGSTVPCKAIVEHYQNDLSIRYISKPNTGPGDSRNHGMLNATGDYFVILDSDCILPAGYLTAVVNFLEKYPDSCFGGPDRSHPSFTTLQKAIDHVMTSVCTTGGIRGASRSTTTYEPRSFNMGLSREAFNTTGGYGTIHPGEDPDLSIRLRKAGIQTRFLPGAYVYHKRRISWGKFYKQVRKFGLVRPILNSWHPETASLTYWFPSFFVLFSISSVFLMFSFSPWSIMPLALYLLLIAFHGLLRYKSPAVALFAIAAVFVQFFGYGIAFFQSWLAIRVFGRSPRVAFPQLFFE